MAQPCRWGCNEEQSLTRFAGAPFAQGSLKLDIPSPTAPLPLRWRRPQGSLYKPEPPLCKGRWRGEAVAEGLYGKTCPFFGKYLALPV